MGLVTNKIYVGYFDSNQTPFKEANGDSSSAQSCNLWFYIHTYNVSLTNRVPKVDVGDNWSKATNYTTVREDDFDQANAPVRNLIGLLHDMNAMPGTNFSITNRDAGAISGLFGPSSVEYSGWITLQAF
jgi:hypothetical protein